MSFKTRCLKLINHIMIILDSIYYRQTHLKGQIWALNLIFHTYRNSLHSHNIILNPFPILHQLRRISAVIRTRQEEDSLIITGIWFGNIYPIIVIGPFYQQYSQGQHSKDQICSIQMFLSHMHSLLSFVIQILKLFSVVKIHCLLQRIWYNYPLTPLEASHQLKLSASERFLLLICKLYEF